MSLFPGREDTVTEEDGLFSGRGAEEWNPGEHWSNPIDDEHPELGVVQRAKLKSLADTGPKTLQKNLENEGFEARHRGGMSFSIRKPGEKDWYVVDPSGFEPMDDTLEFLGSIIPSVAGTTIGGTLGTAAGGVPGGLAGAGAGAAVGEGAKMGLGKLAGIEYDPSEVGGRLEAELALGGLAQGAAPVLGKLGRGAKTALLGEKGGRILGKGFKPGEAVGVKPASAAAAAPPIAGREGLLPGAARLAQEGMERIPESIKAPVARGADRLRRGTAGALEGAGKVAGLPGKAMDKVVKKFRDVVTPGEDAASGYFAGPGLGLGVAWGLGVGPAATKGLALGMGSKILGAGLKKSAKLIMGNPKVLLAHASKAKGVVANKLRKPLQVLETRGKEAYVAAVYSLLHDPMVRAYFEGLEKKDE